MKVLITGASGFLGQHLLRALSNTEHEITAAQRARPLTALEPNIRFTSMGTINREPDWLPLLDGQEAVIHLAGAVHIPSTTPSPEVFDEVNLGGTKQLLHASSAAGVRRFVFMSTVKVLGDETTQNHRLTEADPFHPNDAYAASKAKAEQVLNELETDMERVTIRPPLIHGPNAKANFLRLVRSVERGIPLPLASVTNLRSTVSAQNLTHAISLCLEHGDAPGNTFHVTDGGDFSTASLVRLIARGIGRRPRLLPVPVSVLRAGGKITGMTGTIDRLTQSLRVDDSKIRSLLHWQQPVPAAEAIMSSARSLALS